MKKLNKKGFTLLELLAVLVILAALATIAIPIFTNKGSEARLAAHKANIRELLNAVQRYEWDNGTQATDVATYYNEINASHDLVTNGYISSAPVSPYSGVAGYTKYRYFVGKDPETSLTTVKLVGVHTTEEDPAVSDDADAEPTAGTVLTAGVFNHTTVFELVETTDGKDVQSVVIPE